MSLEELLQAKREDILHTASKYGAYNVRVFGSVARGEAEALFESFQGAATRFPIVIS